MMNKPVAILLTDTHFKQNNLEQVLAIFNQCIELCKKLSVDQVFHLGDVFTAREAQRLDVLLAHKSVCDLFSSNRIYLHEIPGNHDKPDLSHWESYLDLFKGKSKYINIIDGSYAHNQEQFIRLGKLKVFMLPYFTEEIYASYLQQLITYLKPFPKGNLFLMTHQAINGVINNDGAQVVSSIKRKHFEKFDKVFVGHYHNRSKVGDNIYYIGSALQHNFGEDRNKGFCVLYENGSHSYVKSDFPTYEKFVLDIKKQKLNALELIELTKSFDHVRIEIVGEQKDLASLDVEELRESGLEVKMKPQVEILEQEQVVENIQFDRKNLIKHYIQYALKHKLPSSVRKRGIELLTQHI